MLGSTMDTCSVSSRVAFGRFFFYDFLRDWEDSAPEVDSRRSLNMADEEVAVLVVNSSSDLRLQVLLMMHVALCSR